LAKEQEAFANVEVRRYLELEYDDILGKEHIDYYYVPLITGGSPMEPREGKAIFEKYHAARINGTMVEFDKLTGDSLFEHVK
jgi:hypothetical protein